MEGERDSPTTGKALKPFANYWHLGLWVFSWHLHTGHGVPQATQVRGSSDSQAWVN